jgi:hypothetical protein
MRVPAHAAQASRWGGSGLLLHHGVSGRPGPMSASEHTFYGRPAAAAICHAGVYSAMASGTQRAFSGWWLRRGGGGVDGPRGGLPQHRFADLGGHDDR